MLAEPSNRQDIRAVAIFNRFGSTQTLSRREHAPDRRGALNNEVRLITRFYGIHS